MTVYKKLQQARIKLQNTKLHKSGKNKFANYEYFELSDFLPVIQNICLEMGLCGTVHFQEDIATLTIHDVDAPEQFINFSCPLSSAELKGCHPVQNLGAVLTYTRRYLWVNAFEITEHDALDATTGLVDVKPKAEPKPMPTPVLPDGDFIKKVEDQLKQAKTVDDLSDIFKVNRKALDDLKKENKLKYDEVMMSFTVHKNLLTKD